ncbi:MAG: hypothetical protein HUJ91_02515, partial [Bacteroidales bacterium]|nr:hypothetical protein [Bacteroidales bacterium]
AAEPEAESGPTASDDDREAARIMEQAPGREQSRRSPGRTILYILLGLVIAVLAFVIMFHDALWFDTLLDKLLYTEEELELLRSVL